MDVAFVIEKTPEGRAFHMRIVRQKNEFPCNSQSARFASLSQINVLCGKNSCRVRIYNPGKKISQFYRTQSIIAAIVVVIQYSLVLLCYQRVTIKSIPISHDSYAIRILIQKYILSRFFFNIKLTSAIKQATLT